MNVYHQEYPSNSLSLQTEEHRTILDPMNGRLQSDGKSYGNAKNRPLGSNLDPSESSRPMDSSQPYCSCKRTPSITLSPSTQTHFTNFLCDSESLLKRIQRAITRSWANPSHCLASDYDRESGIVDIIATLGISCNYLHVKSHQDDAIDIHLLPWTAQKNVHADTLATNYLDNYSEPSKLVPFIPACKASLTFKGGETITRRLTQRL